MSYEFVQTCKVSLEVSLEVSLRLSEASRASRTALERFVSESEAEARLAPVSTAPRRAQLETVAWLRSACSRPEL